MVQAQEIIKEQGGEREVFEGQVQGVLWVMQRILKQRVPEKTAMNRRGCSIV